ncbi:Bromodomain-containing_protein [Hexamita inflata]|uniref:Bromodomain-containing_protein n=1 Tax=Hexamita inflata TaxID=28002 RepID=A0ABP1GHA3_9EUKA
MNSRLFRVSTQAVSPQLNAFFLQVLDTVRRHKNGPLFFEQVDPISQLLPTYFDYIKRPLCFTQVRFNLSSGYYSFVYEFLRDVRLVFDNCRIFWTNENNKDFVKAADEVEGQFLILLERKIKVDSAELAEISNYQFKNVFVQKKMQLSNITKQFNELSFKGQQVVISFLEREGIREFQFGPKQFGVFKQFQRLVAVVGAEK